MTQSINDKYVKQTMEALSNNQLNVEVVAVRLSQFPSREQHKFFKLAINYIQMLDEHNQRGWTVAGLEPIVKACKDLMDVVELHFPTTDNQPTLPGMEYVQI
jgi:hypothetical protein